MWITGAPPRGNDSGLKAVKRVQHSFLFHIPKNGAVVVCGSTGFDLGRASGEC
jgi:hypothetical protein